MERRIRRNVNAESGKRGRGHLRRQSPVSSRQRRFTFLAGGTLDDCLRAAAVGVTGGGDRCGLGRSTESRHENGGNVHDDV